MRFTADSRRLLSAGADARVQLWDVGDGRVPPRPTATIDSADRRGFMTVAPEPDGSIVATTSTDGSGQLWDVADPSTPRPIGGPLQVGDFPLAAVLTPDGTGLYAGNKAGELVHYDLRGLAQLVADPVAAACDRSGPLDPSEWAELAPGVEYRPVCG